MSLKIFQLQKNFVICFLFAPSCSENVVEFLALLAMSFLKSHSGEPLY